MSDSYQKCFSKSGLVAFCPTGSNIDHVFLWAGNVASDTVNTLEDLLTAWKQASALPGGTRKRTILFCQYFDPATLSDTLDRLTAGPGVNPCWGKLAYSRDSTFQAAGATAFFPTGQATQIQIGNLAIYLASGATPKSLDAFTFAVDDDSTSLLLAIDPATDDWVVDQAHGRGPIMVSFARREGFVAGAIGLKLAWPNNSATPHPFWRTKIGYLAMPEQLPSGEDPVSCRSWSAQTFSSAASTGGVQDCHVLLDPRDGEHFETWLSGANNSRLEFGAATLQSTFYSAAGRAFTLRPSQSAAARLRFVYDQVDGRGTLSTIGNVAFQPEGLFEIVTPDAASGSSLAVLGINPRDLIVGSSATEFLDLSVATHIEFVPSQPAFFRGEEMVTPSQRELLEDFGGLAVTSHIRGHDANNPIAVDYHTGPSEAALFEYVKTNDHLSRRRGTPFGATTNPLPVFPHGGYIPAGPDGAAIITYETTHLGQFRRNISRAAMFQSAADAIVVDPVFAITPQGLLASVTGDGDFSEIYFGNPDSSTAQDEFSLRFQRGTVGDAYNDVQQALHASKLFMVFRNPKPEALATVMPSATLNVRGFAFSVFTPPTGRVDPKLQVDALLIKYFVGMSLADLIQHTELWACQAELAPNGNSDASGWVPHFAADATYLANLKNIWNDPDWQGVLILNLAATEMPDILSALKPGLNRDQGATKPALHAHHFGINAVPVRQRDVTPSGAQPQRAGSAFGLIAYDKGSNSPPPPAAGDFEPGGDDDGARSYLFVVETIRIVFANSQIADFNAKVTVGFSHRFWEDIAEQNGHLPTVELLGYYERRPLPGGRSQDVFSLVTPDEFVFPLNDESYLKQVTISRAQLNVVSAEGGKLTAFVSMEAEAQFSEKLTLPLFTVKSIRFSSFGFEFSFTDGADDFTFGFKADGLSADVDFDPGVVASLMSFLPVKLTGMSVAIGKLLDLGDLKFQPLYFPGLAGAHFGTSFQFGFLLDLDLGSLGGLAGDLRGMHVPMLFGWSGGANRGLALGIQFPTIDGRIDIGIEQFIRLQADELLVKHCTDQAGQLSAIAIQAVDARVVLLGKQWPQADLSFVIFIPVDSGRKPSWALGLDNGEWYVGGGHRIRIPGSDAGTVEGVVDAFKNNLNHIDANQDVCALVNKNIADPGNDNWSIVARYGGSFTVGIAVSDPTLYGLELAIDPLGAIDVMYRRVNDQLGIFSVEYTLPGPERTMQFGAATVRLPSFRLEVHTDGGFLADIGFPWNNDFSRSCQVEIAVFVGSGGFYFGVTSAAASDLLSFDGGYGYVAPDPALLNSIRALRLGFAARVGLGRSFSLGVLSADASITIFGGLEGAVGYLAGKSPFEPTLYALRGYVGLMADIQATVDFSVIRASARLLVYADVGIEIRRVLARASADSAQHYLLTLPLVIFAEIGVTVTASVEIHVGCVHITLHLSFSTTWRYEEQLNGLSVSPFSGTRLIASDHVLALTAPPAWDASYRYWVGQRGLDIFATVLPCMVNAADLGASGDVRTAAVGTMLLPIRPTDNGFSDLVKFLLGWLLLPTQPASIDTASHDASLITLQTVKDLRALAQTSTDTFWTGFADALMTAVTAQFAPALNLLTDNQNELFAIIPLWPGSVFAYAESGGAVTVAGNPSIVLHDRTPMSALAAGFVQYCRQLILGTLPEVQQLIQSSGVIPGAAGATAANDPRTALSWGEIWTQMFQP